MTWKRGQFQYDEPRTSRVSGIWAKKKSHIIAILVLLSLLIAGCALGGFAAVRYGKGRTINTCYARGGGERCQDAAWAKCIAADGLGYCEGVMGKKVDEKMEEKVNEEVDGKPCP